jgi:tRNA U34 2-thiouridine synthase MnmA/TrmU
MSQRRSTFPVVQRESGAGDLLLRPLCAKRQPPTLPERQGWVDREALFDFNGRSRRPQIALAATLGIEEYAQPAGGCCFLTDSAYSRKLRDLWQSRGDKHYELDDIMLLKVGRHIRPRPHFKLIIARDSGETHYLQGYRRRFNHLTMTSHSGPLTLLEGEVTAADIELAARIAARFGQGRDAERVVFDAVVDGLTSGLSVQPLAPENVQPEWYL